MTSKTPIEVVAVTVESRREPEELAGDWCRCPRSGKAVRIEHCYSCEFAVEFHRASDPPHIICAIERRKTRARIEAQTTPVSAIMSTDPVCVKPTLRAERLTLLLIDENIGGVPVVDDDGHAVGMVSKTDLLAEEADRVDAAELAREFPPVGELLADREGAVRVQHTASDLMTTPMLTLRESDSVSAAAQMMAGSSIHHLGVVDASGRLIGILSTLDIVRWLATR